jgi:hypothetical protein
MAALEQTSRTLPRTGGLIIHVVQGLQSPTPDALLKSATALLSKEFSCLLFPLLLWCVDLAVGARIALVLLISACTKVGLKDLFALPQLTAAVVLPLALLALHPSEDAATLTRILLGAGIGIALLRRTLA